MGFNSGFKGLNESRLFPCGNESAMRQIWAEEYCWATRQAAGRSYCYPSRFSVFQYAINRTPLYIDTYIRDSWRYAYSNPTCAGPSGKNVCTATTSVALGLIKGTPKIAELRAVLAIFSCSEGKMNSPQWGWPTGRAYHCVSVSRKEMRSVRWLPSWIFGAPGAKLGVCVALVEGQSGQER